MKNRLLRGFSAPIACFLAVSIAAAADTNNVVQVDWDTRTASCPSSVSQATNVTIRATNVNDLLIDFKSGDIAQYTLRAKGTPVSVVPPENPFVLQTGQPLNPKAKFPSSF